PRATVDPSAMTGYRGSDENRTRGGCVILRPRRDKSSPESRFLAAGRAAVLRAKPGQGLPGVSRRREAGIQLKRSTQCDARSGGIAGFQIRHSEVVLHHGIIRNRGRALLETSQRFANEIFLQVYPAQ